MHSAQFGFATRTIHAGQPPDPSTGAVVLPITLSSTFAQSSPGVNKGYEYSRTNNPTRRALEECIASSEKGKYALCFASGCATLATIVNMFQTGDHLICIDDVYGGTQRIFNQVGVPANGMPISFVDMTAPGALAAAITPKTKLIWLETPTNPMLKMADIAETCRVARASGQDIVVIVDNTFASPYFQSPLELGADIVVHSVTKYLNGHSDVVMGSLITNNEKLYTKLKYLQNAMGMIPSPFDCFMALRGMKTLAVRMEKHQKNALAIAKFLEKHPKVERVLYPALPSHPQHALYKKQMHGFSGMITFFIKGGLDESKIFLEQLKVFALGESLGAVESLAEHPAIMTHASVPAAQRKLLGISDSLIRLSVGIEDVQDLIADLKNALAAVPRSKL